jgi:hypothetical protein
MWIGSASTKRPAHERFDIEIVNTDPDYYGPQQRLLVYCVTSQIAHVIWQMIPAGNVWISQLAAPPYHAFDRGVLGHQHAPQAIPLTLAGGGQHSAYIANWLHNMQFDIDPQQPNIAFKYQSPRTGRITHFRRLRFIQQIQTATLAERMIAMWYVHCLFRRSQTHVLYRDVFV